MTDSIDYQQLTALIKQWGLELGFQKVGITDLDLSRHEESLQAWLDKQYHGEMEYMERHGMLRARPAELHPGSVRAICVRMDYLPRNAKFAHVLKQRDLAYVSRYALGRDYHKLMRKRLKLLGDKIKHYCTEQYGSDADFRPFVDSAPIMERPLAQKAGLGWTGKHSLLMDEKDGSWFFLGELLINLPLPVDQQVEERCGSCTACMTICPTQAIVEPYVVDARRCISYLTIEHSGVIAEEFRDAMGNRIYGCDDCQLICPWNRYATPTAEQDFVPRHELHAPKLLELWAWNEAQFLSKTEGSPIRRIGFEKWQRNLAIALGNAPPQQEIIDALRARMETATEMVNVHIQWALEKQHAGVSKRSRQEQRLIRAIEKGLPRDA